MLREQSLLLNCLFGRLTLYSRASDKIEDTKSAGKERKIYKRILEGRQRGERGPGTGVDRSQTGGDGTEGA